jgi:hypothetical protein
LVLAGAARAMHTANARFPAGRTRLEPMAISINAMSMCALSLEVGLELSEPERAVSLALTRKAEPLSPSTAVNGMQVARVSCAELWRGLRADSSPPRLTLAPLSMVIVGVAVLIKSALWWYCSSLRRYATW